MQGRVPGTTGLRRAPASQPLQHPAVEPLLPLHLLLLLLRLVVAEPLQPPHVVPLQPVPLLMTHFEPLQTLHVSLVSPWVLTASADVAPSLRCTVRPPLATTTPCSFRSRSR